MRKHVSAPRWNFSIMNVERIGQFEMKASRLLLFYAIFISERDISGELIGFSNTNPIIILFVLLVSLFKVFKKYFALDDLFQL